MKVLISDSMSEKAVEIFKKAKEIEVDVITGLKPEGLKEIIGKYDGIAIRSATKMTPDILEAATNLKVIGRAGTGVDNVDVPTASKRGIVVMNTPGGNTITTAEHAVSMMLSLSRSIPQATASIREGKWEKKKFMGKEVFNKTLGVIGLGNIGRIVADRALGLKMHVIAADPFINPEVASKMGIEVVSLDDLYTRSDYITIHVPKTDETMGMINKNAFKKMKKGVFVINCARGGLVNEADLLWALNEGIVAGAALDVFVKEPPEPGGDLFKDDRIIFTPHLGASTEEAQENVAVAVAEQIVDYLAKGVVRNAVNMPSVSPESAPVLRPYIVLAEKMGSFLSQLGLPGLEQITIEYQGEASAIDTPPVTVALLKGILDPILEEAANYVSAPIIIKERGIKIVEAKSEKAEGFSGQITLRAKTNEGERLISGVIIGTDSPRIVRIDNFSLEASPEGILLVTTNLDKPGVIGSIGTTLGENNVNIARMHLARDKEGGNALVIISVDGAVSPVVIDKLKKLPHMLSVQQVRL
jgi:D-3-phosphoglycerate dehydrogenase / 2-oxoglutarate reductase